MTASAPSPVSDSTLSDAQRIVKRARAAGLIRNSVPTAKEGEHAATLAQVNTAWTWVDAETAERWLGANEGNRPVSQDTVNLYAQEMRNGNWTATHQGIAFDERDRLIDGQHRLHAIIKAGVKVRLMVTTGLPHVVNEVGLTTMDAVDRGKPRSVSDQLKIQHAITNPTVVAAVCASLGRVCFGARTKKLSVGQTLTIYTEFKAAVDFVIARRSKVHGLRAAGVLAAFAFAMAVDEQRVQAWFEQLNLSQASAGSALGMLNSFLLSDDARLLNRGSDRGLAELVLQALVFETWGTPVEQLEHGTDGIEFFRAAQPERVAKIAAMFALPEESN